MLVAGNFMTYRRDGLGCHQFDDCWWWDDRRRRPPGWCRIEHDARNPCQSVRTLHFTSQPSLMEVAQESDVQSEAVRKAVKQYTWRLSIAPASAIC